MAIDSPCVVMLHVGRCGSTVIAEMLNRHPRIDWDGEVFEPAVRRNLGDQDLDPVPFLQKRRSRAGTGYGFEVKYLPSHHQGVLHVGLPEMLSMFDDLGVTHYVTLHRRNLLRRVVSGAVGRETRKWHRTAGERRTDTTIRLDPRAVPFGPPQALLAVFDEMERGEAELRDMLDPGKSLHLTYEDHVESDPNLAYGEICRLIGESPEPVRPGLERTGQTTLRATLTNYDEIAALLTATRFEWMLDPE